MKIQLCGVRKILGWTESDWYKFGNNTCVGTDKDTGDVVWLSHLLASLLSRCRRNTETFCVARSRPPTSTIIGAPFFTQFPRLLAALIAFLSRSARTGSPKTDNRDK